LEQLSRVGREIPPPPFLSLDVVKTLGGADAYAENVADGIAAIREERRQFEKGSDRKV
jgi:hypothetical protein